MGFFKRLVSVIVFNIYNYSIILAKILPYVKRFDKYRHKIGCKIFKSRVNYNYCARRGVSGALYLQSAIARLNTLPGTTYGWLRVVRRVDNKVLCNVTPRTVSG